MNGQARKYNDVISEISKYKGIIFDLDETIIDLGIDWDELKKGTAKFLLSRKKSSNEVYTT